MNPIKWLKEFFSIDREILDLKMQQLKQLQDEKMAILNKYDNFGFTELDRIRMDILEIKIDLLLKT